MDGWMGWKTRSTSKTDGNGNLRIPRGDTQRRKKLVISADNSNTDKNEQIVIAKNLKSECPNVCSDVNTKK